MNMIALLGGYGDSAQDIQSVWQRNAPASESAPSEAIHQWFQATAEHSEECSNVIPLHAPRP